MRQVGMKTAAILLLWWMAVPALAGKVRVGDAAPAVSLDDLDGHVMNLSRLRGSVVLLHFWATWCPTCREEMPLLEEVSRAHAGEVVVLGINLGEPKKKVAGYIAEAGLTFPILLDPRGKVAGAYDVLALPTTLIVDPDGLLAGDIPMGKLEREDLEHRLAPLIKKKSTQGRP